MSGVIPAVAIDQSNQVRTSRSTVGTMTEVCDHMKVLLLGWARCTATPAMKWFGIHRKRRQTLLKEMPESGKAWVTFEYAPEEVRRKLFAPP